MFFAKLWFFYDECACEKQDVTNLHGDFHFWRQLLHYTTEAAATKPGGIFQNQVGTCPPSDWNRVYTQQQQPTDLQARLWLSKLGVDISIGWA